MCVFQVRNPLVVIGKAVIKNLHARMNSPDTAEHTRVKKSLSVPCATVASCEATTWPNTPGVTWQLRGRQHGLMRFAILTKRALLKRRLPFPLVFFFLPQTRLRPLTSVTSGQYPTVHFTGEIQENQGCYTSMYIKQNDIALDFYLNHGCL